MKLYIYEFYTAVMHLNCGLESSSLGRQEKDSSEEARYALRPPNAVALPNPHRMESRHAVLFE